MTNHNKLFGSILIFAGTCVGAGMLALPMSTAGAGFVNSTVILFIAGLTSIITSLLILETLSLTPEHIINFKSMSYYTLGAGGKYFCVITYLMLLYALSCAFTSGGASLVEAILSQYQISIPKTLLNITYLSIVACIVLMGHKFVDLFNRSLFTVKGGTLLILCTLLIKDIQPMLLIDTEKSSLFIINAIPIIFFSFGLQVVVPSIYTYMDKDKQATTKAIIYGTLLPLIVYLIWISVTHGILPRFGKHSYADFLSQYSADNIGAFLMYLDGNNSLITKMVNLFAHVAILTSFASVGLGLKDFCSEFVPATKKQYKDVISTFIAFFPPLCILLFFPNIFQVALNFTAAMITCVFVFLPIAMVIKLNREQKSHQWYTNNLTLAIMSIIGVMVLICGLLASFVELKGLADI